MFEAQLISNVSFISQYAYNPPQSSQFQPPQLTHAQAAPARQFQARDSQADPRAMPPPPPPSNHTVAPGGSGTFKPVIAQRIPHRRAEHIQSAASSRRRMGPPPTPQITSNRAAFGSIATQPPTQAPQHRVPKASYPLVAHDPKSTKPSPRFTGAQNNRFMPSANGFVPPTPTSGSQRFVGMPPSISRPSSRAIASGSYASSGQGGQRMPFIPAQGGFG